MTLIPTDAPAHPEAKEAIEKVLKKAGWKIDDVDLYEINEAFSVTKTVSLMPATWSFISRSAIWLRLRVIVRRMYDWVLSWADTPYGTPALAAISFAESSFFPVPPDVNGGYRQGIPLGEGVTRWGAAGFGFAGLSSSTAKVAVIV